MLEPIQRSDSTTLNKQMGADWENQFQDSSLWYIFSSGNVWTFSFYGQFDLLVYISVNKTNVERMCYWVNAEF